MSGGNYSFKSKTVLSAVSVKYFVRFKWSTDNNKQSLAAAQKVLNSFKQDIKTDSGVSSVYGGCQDFKVIG